MERTGKYSDTLRARARGNRREGFIMIWCEIVLVVICVIGVSVNMLKWFGVAPSDIRRAIQGLGGLFTLQVICVTTQIVGVIVLSRGLFLEIQAGARVFTVVWMIVLTLIGCAGIAVFILKWGVKDEFSEIMSCLSETHVKGYSQLKQETGLGGGDLDKRLSELEKLGYIESKRLQPETVNGDHVFYLKHPKSETSERT